MNLFFVNNTPLIFMTIGLLSFFLTFISANAEEDKMFLSPHKQMASGTLAEDVICNAGFTLIAKLSTGASACVKPETAERLEELGWGQILKPSSVMDVERKQMQKEQSTSEYDPQINPNNFVSQINNKFLTLTPGTMFVYESHVDEGIERIEYVVTNEKRIVMGIETIVVWDREWLNDDLVEDTRDWFAQDMEGNVWYFGEESKEFSGGKIVSTKGSWESGIDGAKPGIIMMATPQIGETYRQEYYQNEAEDMGKVISLDEIISVPYGTFSGCLKTKDWTPLETNSEEFKYYCPEVGGVVLEEKLYDEETMELVEVTSSQESTQESEIADEVPIEEKTSEITEAQAIKIAKDAFSGEVTDVGTEYKFGQFGWVVEMMTANGEIDIVIDKTTGEILGVEN